MENLRHDSDDYTNLLNLAKIVLNDKRTSEVEGGHYATALSSGKQALRSILRQAYTNETITENQVKILQSMCNKYTNVVRLNSTYTEEFKQDTISFMEEVIEGVAPYSRNDRSLSAKRGIVKTKLHLIEQGQYFWNHHFSHAHYLASFLWAEGCAGPELIERSKLIKEKTHINYYD
tara:strand:+ start:14137 stop:14664 length:528 start_codon:yes stop_codon:yes gene_type:complete